MYAIMKPILLVKFIVSNAGIMTGTSEAANLNRTQSWRPCYPAGPIIHPRKSDTAMLIELGARHCHSKKGVH